MAPAAHPRMRLGPRIPLAVKAVIGGGNEGSGGKAPISVPKRIVGRPFDSERNRKALNFPSAVIEKAYAGGRGDRRCGGDPRHVCHSHGISRDCL